MRGKSTRKRPTPDAPTQPAEPPVIWQIALSTDLQSLGFVSGTTLNAHVVDRLEAGELAVVKVPDGLCIGRVVCADRHGFTLHLDGEDCHHTWEELITVGRIVVEDSVIEVEG